MNLTTREQELFKELDEAKEELLKVQEEIQKMQFAEVAYRKKIFSCEERINELVKIKSSN
jgi:hypothetical protein